MKKLIHIKFIFICACMLLGVSSRAQTDSLMHYLDLATRNNPLIQQKYNEYLAVLEKVPQVGALQDPELSLGIFLSPMELVGGNQVADIRLMQMFPWFGVLKNAKDEMSLMAKAKFEEFRDTKLQVYFDMQQIWIQMQNLKQQVSISEKNIEILKSIERISLVKYKASASSSTANLPTNIPAPSPENQTNGASSSGMGGMSGSAPSMPGGQSSSMQAGSMGGPSTTTGLASLYRLQIEMGELENSLALIKDQQINLIAQFNSYLNRPSDHEVLVPDSLKPSSIDKAFLLNTDSIKTNNPMLGMIQYEQQSLEARKRMVSKMGYPMIGLGINYSLINKNDMSTSAMNGDDMIMPMVTVSLPIYRKKYKAMQKEADLLKIANEHAYQETTNALLREYNDARQQFFDAERRIKLYENQYILSKRTLDLILKSFSVTTASLDDVLRSSQQTLEYELKKTEAIADYNKAQAWLKRLGSY